MQLINSRSKKIVGNICGKGEKVGENMGKCLVMLSGVEICEKDQYCFSERGENMRMSIDGEKCGKMLEIRGEIDNAGMHGKCAKMRTA